MYLYSSGRRFLFVVVLNVISLLCFSALQSRPGPKSPGESIHQEILNYVNQYRQSKGLPPLQPNVIISAEAEKHSANMASKKSAFGHDGFEDRVRLITEKIGRLNKSAENVAYGKISAKEVVANWLKSPGHRKNIEGNYTLTGIGISKAADGTLYFTEIFAAK